MLCTAYDCTYCRIHAIYIEAMEVRSLAIHLHDKGVSIQHNVAVALRHYDGRRRDASKHNGIT